MSGKVARKLRNEAWDQDSRFAYKEKEYKRLEKGKKHRGSHIRSLYHSFYNHLKTQYKKAA